MSIDFTGQTITQYEIKDLLKERISSSLYQAEDRKSHKKVFLEILHATADEDEDLAGSFQRRMTTVAQLAHPHIAPVLYTGQTDEKRPYAIIQHSDGQFMDAQVTHWQETGVWPSPIAILQLIKTLAETLAVAHPAGLIHHDLRPANILIRPDGSPLLIDLGVPITPLPAKINIEPGQIIYLDYTSPEQRKGQPLTGPSNVYSLGIMLYQALSGTLPPIPISKWSIFEEHMLPMETPLEEVKQGLSQETYTLVKTCLWRQEWNRYETMQTMLEKIEAALAAEQANPSPVKSNTLSHKKQYLLYGGIALIIIVLIVVAIMLLSN